uniref:Polyprotein n=1 Tax=Angiostrongylus cantonensis TaxID=6313 RepID=A0A0K0DIY1_ANGCA
LNNIAKKLEERQQIMKEITRRHEKSFTIKKNKTSIIGCAVIRKKADRSRLQGVACAASKAYFDALELSPESKEQRINKVSRVRVVAQRMPSTPENYWEEDLPLRDWFDTRTVVDPGIALLFLAGLPRNWEDCHISFNKS